MSLATSPQTNLRVNELVRGGAEQFRTCVCSDLLVSLSVQMCIFCLLFQPFLCPHALRIYFSVKILQILLKRFMCFENSGTIIGNNNDDLQGSPEYTSDWTAYRCL